MLLQWLCVSNTEHNIRITIEDNPISPDFFNVLILLFHKRAQKGTGFVILNNKDVIRKIEEQIRESVVSNTDLTFAITSKIQKHLFINNKSLKLELISNFIFPILFHHVFMES